MTTPEERAQLYAQISARNSYLNPNAENRGNYEKKQSNKKFKLEKNNRFASKKTSPINIRNLATLVTVFGTVVIVSSSLIYINGHHKIDSVDQLPIETNIASIIEQTTNYATEQQPVESEGIVPYTDLETTAEEDNTNEIIFTVGTRSDIDSINGLKQIYYSENLEEVFTKYAQMYGVDANVLVAIASLESSLNHTKCLPDGENYDGYAVGIMQWQTPPEEATDDYKFVAYNYITQQYDTEYLTMDNAKDLDTNVKMAAMHFQQGLKHYNGNVYLAIARHHYGEGAVDRAIKAYADSLGITFDDVCNDFHNTGWIDVLNDLHENPDKYGLKGGSNGKYGTDNYVSKVLDCAFSNYCDYNYIDSSYNVYNCNINLETTNYTIDYVSSIGAVAVK